MKVLATAEMRQSTAQATDASAICAEMHQIKAQQPMKAHGAMQQSTAQCAKSMHYS
jgi:hypothetical protein